MKTSSYYDTDNFKSLVNTKIKSFGILSTNIQTINTKFNELAVFVQELHLVNNDFSIICIQEITSGSISHPIRRLYFHFIG